MKTEEIIKNRLISYIDEMNKWEIYNKKESNKDFSSHEEFDEATEKTRDKLKSIYEKYCTKRVLELKCGRMASLRCSTPPEYAVNTQPIQKVEQINKNKYHIYTKQLDGFKKDFRYTMVFKEKEWRLDKKESYSELEEKWDSRSL